MSKHAFITSSTDIFLNIFLANRIEDGSLKRDDIFVVKIKSIYDHIPSNEIEDIEGIRYVTSDEIDQHDWESFKTINIISLNSNNAFCCRCLLDKYCINACKINIFITDDEVERWYNLYKHNGKIIEDSLSFVDRNVLYCLQKLSNFITPRKPWGDILEKILGRHLNISDTTLALSILPYSAQEGLYNNFGLKMRNRLTKARRKNVMIYTKPQDWKKTLIWVLSLIRVIYQIDRENIYGYTCFSYWLQPFDKRFPIYLSLLLARAISSIRKISVEIKIIYQVPPEIYFLNIFDYNFLIAQDRGGYTMIQEFMRHRGRIFVNKDSFNSIVITNEKYSMVHEYLDKKTVVKNIMHFNELEERFNVNANLSYDAQSRAFFKDMFSIP